MKKLLARILILALLWYLFLTPEGALRLAVAIRGYPMQAIALRVAEDIPIEENQTLFWLENPPRDEATGAGLSRWIVTRYLFVYIGSCDEPGGGAAMADSGKQ